MRIFPKKRVNTLLKKHSKSFYLASLFLQKDHAKRVTCLYEFCRSVDDLADKYYDPADALLRLTQWYEQLKNGNATEHLVADVLNLARDNQIETTHLVSLVEGVISDLGEVKMLDESQLTRYCYLVAGTVGLMMCRLLGADDSEAKKHAVDLGIAMQLTNILRDVAEDAIAGRQYIPQTWLPANEKFLELCAKKSVHVTSALQRLFALTQQYYASGYAGLSYLPFQSRFSILVAARLYQEITFAAKRKQFRHWQKRIVISAPRKCWIISICVVRVIRDYVVKKEQPIHNNQLHTFLRPWLNS